MLISGQRGAGKTTLARLAIQALIVEGENLIPLPIFLHGPTMLSPPTEKQEDGDVAYDHYKRQWALPRDGRSQGNVSAPLDATVKQHALKHIIAALYRELSDTFYHAWGNAALLSDSRRRSLDEVLELRAHFDLIIDRLPEVETFRKIWDRAGFLNCGVIPYLYYWRQPPPNAIDMVTSGTAAAPSDQGLREILALHKCAAAFGPVVGERTENIKTSRSSRRQQLRGAPPAVPKGGDDTKKLEGENGDKSGDKKPERGHVGAVLTSVTSSIVGAALATVTGASNSAGEFKWLIAALGALGTWAASWLLFGVALRKQEEKRESSRDANLEIYWTLERLERDFPGLIKRVKEAGFAPIFVIDELDKLPDTNEKLFHFLALSKHIVTENAAFLFLTNRDYYDDLVALELS